MNLFIAGGTGAFGKKIIEHVRYGHSIINKIYVYSRDYKKQNELKNIYPNWKDLNFIVGDIKDSRRLFTSFPDNVDIVINATNITDSRKLDKLGTEIMGLKIEGHCNLLEMSHGLRYLLLSNSSTITPKTLGNSLDLLQEKITLLEGGSIFRFPLLHSSDICDMIWEAKCGKVITMPSEEATRFLLSIDDCADWVVSSFSMIKGNDIYYRLPPSCSMATLAKAIVKRYGTYNTIRYLNEDIIKCEKLNDDYCSSDDMSIEEVVNIIELIKEGTHSHEFVIKF